MILLLAGCGAVGLDPQKPGEEAAPVTITSIDPAWGPPDEDTPVTITGAGFEGDLVAWFGNAEVAVTRVDDATLVTTAPAAGVEAVVDVVVRSELGEAVIPGGFTYAEEAPPDTGGGGGDDTGGPTGGEDNRGRTTGIVELALVQVACPSCLGYTETINAWANAAFHPPVSASWLDWLPAQGSCALNPAAGAPSSTFLDGGEWLYLTAGSVSIGLRNSDGVYAAANVDENDWVRSAAWDLSLAEGGADLDAFAVTDALFTPESITALTPEELLYTTPQTAFAARVRASSATFTWSPPGGDGSFLVIVDVYSPQGSFLDEVVCVGPDNGALTVPSSWLSGYPNQSLLVVGLYRLLADAFQRPDDQSDVDTMVTFGVMGTGTLSP